VYKSLAPKTVVTTMGFNPYGADTPNGRYTGILNQLCQQPSSVEQLVNQENVIECLATACNHQHYATILPQLVNKLNDFFAQNLSISANNAAKSYVNKLKTLCNNYSDLQEVILNNLSPSLLFHLVMHLDNVDQLTGFYGKMSANTKSVLNGLVLDNHDYSSFGIRPKFSLIIYLILALDEHAFQMFNITYLANYLYSSKYGSEFMDLCLNELKEQLGSRRGMKNIQRLLWLIVSIWSRIDYVVTADIAIIEILKKLFSYRFSHDYLNEDSERFKLRLLILVLKSIQAHQLYFLTEEDMSSIFDKLSSDKLDDIRTRAAELRMPDIVALINARLPVSVELLEVVPPPVT